VIPERRATSVAVFLFNRLTEDETLARAATRYHGRWMQGFGPEANASEVYEVTQEELNRADGCDGEHPIGSPNPCEFNVLMEPGVALEALPVMDDVAAHVARHDPTRVLAEVAAKRALLDYVLSWRHDDPDEGGYHACPAVRTESLGDLPFGEDECTCGLRLRQWVILAPFAAAYADHPDYCADEWSPRTRGPGLA
jgi:hypothetical protein